MPHKVVLLLMFETEDDRLNPATFPAQNATEAHRIQLMTTVREAHPGTYTMLAIMGEHDAENMCKTWVAVQQGAHGANKAQVSARPNHWSTETSGILRNAVTAYLEPRLILTADQVGVLREYFALWMQGNWQGEHIPILRTTIKDIKSRADITQWLDRAVVAGIDPL